MKKETKITKGYKVTNSKMQCCPDGVVFQYELNKIYNHIGILSPCNSGFHYCPILADCFGYYTFTTENRVFEIIDHGTCAIKEDKCCTNSIELIRELSWLEVLELVNMGKGNSGIRNAGNRNAGDYNTGNDNAGNRNTGAFNNMEKPPYYLFNKPSKWTYDDFINSPAYSYLSGIETTLWIPDYKMSDQEKKAYPFYITTKGYVKYLPYKKAFANAWNNWSEKAKQSFKDLPNFDKEVFFDITGIKV